MNVLQRERGRQDAGAGADKERDIVLQIAETCTRLKAQIKKWAAHANPGALMDQLGRLGEPGEVILVADYVNPNMADRLKEAGIQFIDTAGNAYLNNKPVLVYIKGNKPPQARTKRREMKTGRAFQQAGLKVVYAILKDQDLINAPYRQIAKRAGVALGNIGWVMGDLIQQGFLNKAVRGKQKTVADFDGLLDKWVEEYPYRLREKLRLGTFTGDANWLAEMALDEIGGLWGGEKAAAAYTGYLLPQDYTIYTHKERLKDIVTFGRLRKAETDNEVHPRVDIYEIFWTNNLPVEEANVMLEDCTDPVITYADLIATGDPRNLETAQRLREKLIH